MTAEQLLEALGKIDDQFILDAHPPKKSRPRAWAGIAACFCVILLGSLFFFQSPEPPVTPAASQTEQEAHAAAMTGDYFYNGCFYILANDHTQANLDARQLPWPIPEEHIGPLEGYAKTFDGQEFVSSPVYSYTPLGVEGVKISVDADGEYCYLLFMSDREGIETEDPVNLGNFMTEYFGLTSPEDICYIVFDRGYTDEGLKQFTITDHELLVSFYDALTGLEGHWDSMEDFPDSRQYYFRVYLDNGLYVHFEYPYETSFFVCQDLLVLSLDEDSTACLTEICALLE